RPRCASPQKEGAGERNPAWTLSTSSSTAMSSSAFLPARGLRHPDLQTLYGYLVGPERVPTLRSERWATHVGDFLDLDVREAPAKARHLILLQGLEGSSRSGSARSRLRGAHARGWGATAITCRSCSGVPNRQLRSYSSGETDDPRWVLRELQIRGVSGPLL